MTQSRQAGDWQLRNAKSAHRIVLNACPCMTLFLTGPKIREWGFHCPEKGWVHWRDFCDPADHGKVGKGCK